MKEQLKQYLTEIAQLIEQGGAFALEQLPLFVQEYLSYYTWMHGIICIIMLILMGVIFFIWYKFNESENWRESEVVPSTVLALIVSIIPLGVFVTNFLNFLKILIAPRVYLIENLTQLI